MQQLQGITEHQDREMPGAFCSWPGADGGVSAKPDCRHAAGWWDGPLQRPHSSGTGLHCWTPTLPSMASQPGLAPCCALLPGSLPAAPAEGRSQHCSSLPPPRHVCLKYNVFSLGLSQIFHPCSQPTAGEGRSLAAMRKVVSPSAWPFWWGRQAAASRKMPNNFPCFPWLPG